MSKGSTCWERLKFWGLEELLGLWCEIIKICCCLVLFFRVYQYQKEAFLWASTWVGLCLKPLNIQMKPKLMQSNQSDPEATTETLSIPVTLPCSLSWHRWRAEANLFHNWASVTQKRRSTKTTSAACPLQHQHHIHPVWWRGSPAKPTPSTIQGFRGWAALAQMCKVII